MTKKRQRVVHTSTTSTAAIITDSSSGAAVGAPIHSFPDSSEPDVILRLFVDPSLPSLPSPTAGTPPTAPETHLHLHSHVLRRCNYFSALLSDRWTSSSPAGAESKSDPIRLNLGIPSTIDAGVRVLSLLYTGDFTAAIDSAAAALDLLPVALKLLFEDCVKFCVRFLEAVPWTEEEEARVLILVPLLGGGDEVEGLVARVSPGKKDSGEEMLHGLIVSAIHSHPNMAFVKAFVARLMREFSARDSARRVLERAFRESLKVVRESLEEYSNPSFRGVVGDNHDETEAVQRLNLHTAMTNGKHLAWLVERMIELRVADAAAEEWSDQTAFATDLMWAFHDGAWRNIVPGLPSVVLRCTLKFAAAVAGGGILATTQVNEMKKK